MKKCPFCAEDIQDAAIFCRYCRRDLPPAGQPSTADSEYTRNLRDAFEPTLVHARNDTVTEQHRIGSLQGLLTEAVSRGSVRDVVSAFAEAVAVWGDLDVRAYVAGARGRFFQYVSLVGADPSAMAGELDDAVVPVGTAMVRLSVDEAERLGLLSKAEDVLIRRIATETGAGWLMVFAGTINAHDEARLTFCSDLLHKSLNDLTIATTTHARTAIRQHLSLVNEPVEVVAQLALDEVVAAVDAGQGALVVTTASGLEALAVGDVDVLPAFDRRDLPDRLVLRTQLADDGGLMALVVGREGGGFTAHERGILEAAVAILRPWVRTVVQRSGQGERRRTARSVHELIERLAAETVQAGGRASVILMSIDHAVLRPGLMQAWLAKIRAQLRPLDLAGVLTSSEIGVLLHDAAADQAAAVATRLKDLLESNGSAGESVEPSLGIISGSAGSPFDGSVVRAARDAAARRAHA